MKVLVVGASSYVGAKLFVDLQKKFVVLGTFHSNQLFSDLVKLDITDREVVLSCVSSFSPDVVVHVAAAPKSWCLKNPVGAHKVNVLGTENVVEAAKVVGAKFVLVSTYYAVSPVDVYGETKFAAEKVVESSGLSFCILRPATIFGLSPNTTNDHGFNRMLKQLTGSAVSYSVSRVSQFTWLQHLSDVLVQVVEKDVSGVVCVATDSVHSRFELARDLLSPFGVRVLKSDGSSSSVVKQDVSMLVDLGLPTCSYEQMVRGIVREMRGRK